jgi:dTDP-4-amino-4,6-dideoxygalactose transaminase
MFLRSDFLTTGPKVAEFEQTVADFVGAKYDRRRFKRHRSAPCGLLAAGIKEGDEVITRRLLLPLLQTAFYYCGGHPVFADINADTYNIDPDDKKGKSLQRTKEIIPVHLTVQPATWMPIHAICR